MDNLHENDKKEDSISYKLVAIGIIGLVSIILVAASFYLHITVNEVFTENPQNKWRAFGEYFGGILSPILAFFALIALLISIHYQVTEFQKSTKQLKESSIALKEQNILIQEQISEARNYNAKEAEIKKIDAINEFLLEIISSLVELLAIKRNYFNQLNNHPAQRASVMQPILTNSHSSNPQIYKLIFLEKSTTLPRRKFSGDIIYLGSVLDNYKTIIEMLRVRNDLHIDIALNPSLDTPMALEFPQADPSTYALFRRAGVIRGVKLVHLTRELIDFIDRTLNDLYQITQELPDIAESLISHNILEEYNKVLRYSLNKRQEDLFNYNVPINEDLYNEIMSKRYI